MTELKTTSIMLTVEQWERLRDEAHETRRSQSEIVREALEMRWAQKEKEEKKMKTYWIDECIVTPEGKLLPKGFELHIEGETARIVVPSDVPGDKESLYEEEIQLSQETFAATYENGTPVHIEDGETIGKEVAKMTGEVYKVLMVDGEKVLCIDTTDGFILEIGGQKYHVYADEDGSTHVDLVVDAEREYIGMINDLWTGDEKEAARFIISFWNGDGDEDS